MRGNFMKMLLADDLFKWKYQELWWIKLIGNLNRNFAIIKLLAMHFEWNYFLKSNNYSNEVQVTWNFDLIFWLIQNDIIEIRSVNHVHSVRNTIKISYSIFQFLYISKWSLLRCTPVQILRTSILKLSS